MDERVKIMILTSGLVKRILKKYKSGRSNTFIVGISGGPAVGKSTVAELITSELNKCGVKSAYCPMDGFHFSNKKLVEMGLSDVKGKIETFDVEAFKGHLAKLKSDEKPFYWPKYCREIHDPVAEGILIESDINVFIVEGNYIFADCEGWKDGKSYFDLKIFLKAKENIIRERLLKRHLAGGKEYKIAIEKIETVDIPNAKKIMEYQQFADIVIE